VNLLSAEKISKSYSEKILLNQVSLGINEGDKIGVIGVNGTGKSTLLKILAGIESADEGNIIRANGLRIEYLPQSPSFEAGTSVLQYIFKGNSPVMRLLREYEAVSRSLEASPGNNELERKLISLTQQMDALQAWTAESEAKAILTKLGISDFEADVSTLSGGQKKRVAIASALINPADLLILDEPTNHIDNITVDWLEKYLNNRKGALIMVTHDRYFLDRVTNRTIEIDNGRLFSYQSNYSKFLELKAEREELEQANERKRRNLYRRELEWIRRGAQARSTKQKARIERFEALKSSHGPSAYENVEIKAGFSRLGKKTIELENISKAYNEKVLIKDFSYILARDDRIGIIGENGSGKTTLLKIMAGRLQPDSGTVMIGDTIKIGFFGQENDEMDESMRVIEYIRDEAEYIVTPDGNITASQMLENFLFPLSEQWKPISKLSGGEKRRLYLLRVLMSAPNVLMLDEPTNDLDIQTLTILESYLDDFPGAVVTVSHDRYFLDRVAEKIFLLGGSGTIERFEGNYSYYAEESAKRAAAEDISASKAASSKGGGSKAQSSSDNNGRKKDRPLKFSFKEQREYDKIDGIIADLEGKIDEINRDIEAASTDFAKLQELLAKKEQLEAELDKSMERWVYLNELAEAIKKSKE
jgi:ATP-binding cassette subfamily F protein uup